MVKNVSLSGNNVIVDFCSTPDPKNNMGAGYYSGRFMEPLCWAEKTSVGV